MWGYLSPRPPPGAERRAHPQHWIVIQQPSQCIKYYPKGNLKRLYMHTNITSNPAPLAAAKIWTKMWTNCIMRRILQLQLIYFEINLYATRTHTSSFRGKWAVTARFVTLLNWSTFALLRYSFDLCANFVHLGTFQIFNEVIFYTLGRLLNNSPVLRMRPPLRSGRKTRVLTCFRFQADGDCLRLSTNTRLKHS